MGSIVVKDNDAPVAFSVQYFDAEGAPTEPDSPPVWTVSDPSVLTIDSVDPSGTSGVVSFGAPGASTLDGSTTDADGTVVLVQGTVTVQPGEAVMGEVNFAVPTP